MDRTDKALIRETLAGELSSFDELMRRYERLVYRVCLLYGVTKENALDISQNVFLRCYRKLDTFRGESSFKTWLLRIAYNEGLTWVRARRRRGRHDELDEVVVEKVSLTADGHSQERDLLEREKRTLLITKIEELNPRQRTAVTLRYFRQMPLREIASILDCSEGNVKNMLFRSVRKLRESLEGTGIEGWT